MDDKNSFDLIFDAGQFDEAFRFVRSGFGWSDEFADNMSRLVLTSQKNTPVAAVNRTNGQINIALLILCQGVTADGRRTVLNLSAWYASPEKRGVVVVNFAKKLLAELQSYIVTNYTPNDAAGKIFRSLGFKPMDVSMVRGGFFKRPPFLGLKAFRGLKASGGAPLIPLEPLSSLLEAGEGGRYSLYPRKVMGIRFNIINIYQVDKEHWPPGIWRVVWLMVRNRAAMLVLYFIDGRQSKDRAKWLIYDSVGDTRFIPPLGSELNIIK